MISIICFTFGWFCPSGLSAQCTSDTLSHWNQSIAIDGELDEWQQDSFRYDKQTGLWYDLANDDVFLYLAVKKDEHYSKIFAWGGLMFTVSTNGKESRDRNPSVIFPRARNGDQRIPNDELTTIEVQNIPQIEAYKLNIYNEYGIQIGWTLDPGREGQEPTYRYELAIPLSCWIYRRERLLGLIFCFEEGAKRRYRRMIKP